MPVVVSCSCGARFEAKDTLLGKRVKCPQCGGALAIPSAQSQAAGAASAQPQSLPSQAAPRQPQPNQATARQQQPPQASPAQAQKRAADPRQAQQRAAAQRQTQARRPVPQSPAGDVPVLSSSDVVDNDPLGLGSDPLGGDPLGLGGDPLGGDPLGGGDLLAGVDASAFPAAPAGGALAGGMGMPGGMGMAGGAAFAVQKPAREGLHPAVIYSMIGAGGVVVLMIGAIVVMSIIHAFKTPQVATGNNPPSGTQTVGAGGPQTSGQTSGSGTGSSNQGGGPTGSGTGSNGKGGSDKGGGDSTNPFVNPPDATGTGNTGTGGSGTSNPVQPGVPTLPAGVEKWYTDQSQTLWGARRVEEDDPIIARYSWMVELLPHLGHQAIYDRFDLTKSWADSVNDLPVAAVIPQFINPADDRYRWKGYPFHSSGLTHFAGMSGIEDGRSVVAAKLPRNDPRAGIFGYDEVVRLDQITDGAANTIMIIGNGELVSPWAAGGGATIRGAREPYFKKIGGFGSRGTPRPGAYASFADGSVRFLSADMDPSVFRALATVHGGESIDAGQIPETIDSLPMLKPQDVPPLKIEVQIIPVLK